jgi:allantoinase
MAELADEPTTLMFHAEKAPTETNGQESDGPTGPVEAYSTFLASRPSSYETTAVETILALAHTAPNLALHIVHLSAMEVIPLLRKARAQGVNITAETCFHYLSLAAEQIRDGDTRHKCCPPIRSQANQDGLWAELERHVDGGVIQTVVSDHSPCTPDLKLLPSHIPGGDCSHANGVNGAAKENGAPKENGAAPKENGKPVENGAPPVENAGSFMSAWGGVSSVGLGLPVFWTELSQRKGLTSAPEDVNTKNALQDVVRLCCSNTAAQVGLEKQKGDLVVGFDADICVFDDSAEWVVEPSTMLFRNKCSPFQGRNLRGMVRETWLRGERVFSRADGFTSTAPAGRLLLEKRANRV